LKTAIPTVEGFDVSNVLQSGEQVGLDEVGLDEVGAMQLGYQ
jgi:hypothetical protein